MGVSNQLEKVIKKIGVKFTNVINLAEDYLDLDSPKSSSISWTNESIRPFVIKSGTNFKAGDVVSNQIDGVNYLIASIKEDMLLGQSMNKYGKLLVCNAVPLFYEDVGTRDDDTLEYTSNWSLKHATSGLIVKQRLDLLESGSALITEGVWYLYVPASPDIKILQRVEVLYVNYKVKSIDSISLPGISILELDLDTR